ncbi:hypothetical protein [Pseudonocardia sp.]|uniref:hypothetical protein n=1 Tax=Pseudonocardia sp. TaxID=60912 RepID=UPI0031FCEC0A
MSTFRARSDPTAALAPFGRLLMRLPGRTVLVRADHHPVADGTGDAGRRAHLVTIGVTSGRRIS